MVTNMWPTEHEPVYGIFVRRQVDSLRDLKFDIDLIFIDGRRSRFAYLLGAIRVFFLNFRSNRPALVHAHGGEAGVVARLFLRGPVLISYCGADLLGSPAADGSIALSWRIRRWLLRRHACLANATITKSKQMEDTLPPRIRSRNTVVPNGINRSLFRPMSRSKARSELGWRDDDVVVLFAANPDNERKGFKMARSACEIASKKIDGLRLQVAWGVPPDKMPKLMAAADCLLFPSLSEGSPNVVKEAIACALPVITTDVGDVRYLLASVSPSRILPADPAELSTGLVELLSHPVRSNGYEVSEQFDERLVALRIADLYDEVLTQTL